jgi:hypothetical protein
LAPASWQEVRTTDCLDLAALIDRTSDCEALLDRRPAKRAPRPGLRSAGYEADEFREMLTEMAWNPGYAVRGR